jgi:hypothetical protein
LRPKKVVRKAKRPRPKNVTRREARPVKRPSTPVAETTIVDVVEESAPGVITITEFQETDIREADAGREPPEET